AADAVLAPTTPLLEEERDSLRLAQIADRLHPSPVHRARFGTGFTADNNPMNARQIEVSEILQQGLDRQKAGWCIDGLQPGNTRQAVFAVLDRHTNPGIVGTMGTCEIVRNDV